LSPALGLHKAKGFYEEHGFISSPANPMTLMITASKAAKVLARAD
jgi:hypothetical protein